MEFLLIFGQETAEQASATVTENDALNFILAIVTMGVAVGMVPFTIRAASGILGRVMGVVNNPNRGPFDRARKALGERRTKSSEYKRENERARRRQQGQNWGRVRRGWSNLKTGDVGYGRKYKTLQRTEAESQALSIGQREQLARLQGEDQQSKVGQYIIGKQVAEWSSQGVGQREIQQRLERMATDTQLEPSQQYAAMKQLVTMRAAPQLENVLLETAQSGDRERVAFVRRFINDNFGDIDGFAAHISRSNIDVENRRVEFGYGALSEFNGEMLAKQKPETIKGALAHAQKLVQSGRTEDGQKLFQSIVQNYANVSPDERSPVVTNILKQAVEQKTIEVPERDTSGRPVTYVNEEGKETTRVSPVNLDQLVSSMPDIERIKTALNENRPLAQVPSGQQPQAPQNQQPRIVRPGDQDWKPPRPEDLP